MIKKLIKTVLILVGTILLTVVGYFLFLTVTEYRPADIQPADSYFPATDAEAAGKTVTVCTWNIGYAGLGKESDFFMDGGKMVYPPSQEIVERNLNGILDYMSSEDIDAWILQEIDLNATRSGHTDQFLRLHEALDGCSAYARNFKCAFVAYPLPPLGQMDSGIATFSRLQQTGDPMRVSLPSPFRWPVSTGNLKRCLLVNRIAVEGSDRELVIVNLHLEAFESGEGRIEQARRLIGLLQEEYEKGNYVIAGGDFNAYFPGMNERFPVTDDSLWTPGILTADMLPEGWQFAFDSTNATCRSMNLPYHENSQLYSIDGFILSPNLRLDEIGVQKLGFVFADHDPVRMTVTLLP